MHGRGMEAFGKTMTELVTNAMECLHHAQGHVHVACTRLAEVAGAGVEYHTARCIEHALAAHYIACERLVERLKAAAEAAAMQQTIAGIHGIGPHVPLSTSHLPPATEGAP